MRIQLAINALTAAVTLAVLVGIAALAVRFTGDDAAQASPAPAARLAVAPAAATLGDTPDAAATPAPDTAALTAAADGTTPLLGVVSDPWQVRVWNAGVDRRFNAVMAFDDWSTQRDLAPRLAQAARRGIVPVISWEPWQPTPVHLGTDEQGAAQPAFANATIADGLHDVYIRRVAAQVKAAGIPVMIRWGHEMNGRWYPWSNDPAAYVRAWRHIVDVFRAEGATNARFVWSVNANLWQTNKAWRAGIDAYWPGDAYVDWVGSTLIGFRGKGRTVADYAPRIDGLRTFKKPILLTEVNVDFPQRARFLSDLRTYVAKSPWIRGAILSQAASRGVATGAAEGDLDWTAYDDPTAATAWGALMSDLGATTPSAADIAP